MLQVALGNNEEPSGSLLKTYNLSDEADESIATNSNNENDQVSKEKEVVISIYFILLFSLQCVVLLQCQKRMSNGTH